MTWAITWLNFPETITYNHVMQAVNDMCQKNVGLMVKKVGCVDHIKSCKLWGSIPCQNTYNLSAAGQRFDGVYVDKNETKIPSFQSGPLQQLLDVCSAFYDLNTYQSKGTLDTACDTDKTIIAAINDRVNSKDVQAAVKTVCDQVAGVGRESEGYNTALECVT